MGEGIEMLDFAAMAVALDEGAARHLSQTITKYIQYQNAWWGMAPFGWVKLTDPRACESLDAAAAKLAAADAAVQRSAARVRPVAQPAGESR